MPDGCDPTRIFDDCGNGRGGSGNAQSRLPDDHEDDHSHESLPSEDTMISTRITERLGIRHPIICAPMAYVAGGALAAAVASAGGLGIVAGGYAGVVIGEPDLEIELARAKSGKFGVGFITWALAQAPKMLTKALQHSPFCVFLSFGDPRPFAAEIRDAGATLIARCSSCRRSTWLWKPAPPRS